MKKIIISTILILVFLASAIAQENEVKIRKKINSNSISLGIQESAKPDVYIDGIKYDAAIVELLDQSLIATVNVIKGEDAAKKYQAPNGVVFIITKKKAEATNTDIEISNDNTKIEIQKDVDPSKKPLVIIDGKESNHETMKELNPDDIESIDVFKGESAMSKFNSENGVIVIKTKNRKD